jgi:hypothetical protein
MVQYIIIYKIIVQYMIIYKIIVQYMIIYKIIDLEKKKLIVIY